MNEQNEEKKQKRPSLPTVLDKKTNLNKIFSLTSRNQIDYEKQLVATDKMDQLYMTC